jgi:hypothetical protein
VRAQWCAAARFHRYSRGLARCKKFAQLGASELLSPDLAGPAVDPVQLHHALCQVQTIRGAIHFGASVLIVARHNATLALRCCRSESPPAQRWSRHSSWGSGVGSVHTISHRVEGPTKCSDAMSASLPWINPGYLRQPSRLSALWVGRQLTLPAMSGCRWPTGCG